jgi:hypothetical protein
LRHAQKRRAPRPAVRSRALGRDRARADLLHAPLMLIGRSLALAAFLLDATLAFDAALEA